MGKREATLESRFVHRMAECGFMSYKGDASAEKQTGWADRFFWGYGAVHVIVEFKREDAPKKRKGEKLQNHIREQLIRRGFRCYRVQGVEEARLVFTEITGEVL